MHNSQMNYTSSIHYDRRLFRQDIDGSIAHTRMLAKQNIVKKSDALVIIEGLESIRDEIETDTFPWREDLEDIHMNIEHRLFEKIGDVAGNLHTGRSRNDQVVLDMRMYAKEATRETLTAIRRLREVLLRKAEENTTIVMPGYTHLQKAQPILFAHHMMAYFEMLGRDRQRFQQCYTRTDVMPLGSGALAGVPYPIDREYVTNELGFSKFSSNSMDAVSDRDFLLDFLSAAAICAVHLSRLAEELVIWSSEEFALIQLPNEYTSGSSIMPQKRNPDFAEIARGKTGRVFGNLIGLLTVLKGLPLTYNRDLQEDKEGFFDTADTLLGSLQVIAGMVSSMKINSKRMQHAAEYSDMIATDIADYLVSKGMPFREAHGIVSKISTHASEIGKRLSELDLQVYRRFSSLFEKEVLSITVKSSMMSRNIPGGTSAMQVEKAIADAKTDLETNNVE